MENFDYILDISNKKSIYFVLENFKEYFMKYEKHMNEKQYVDAIIQIGLANENLVKHWVKRPNKMSFMINDLRSGFNLNQQNFKINHFICDYISNISVFRNIVSHSDDDIDYFIYPKEIDFNEAISVGLLFYKIVFWVIEKYLNYRVEYKPFNKEKYFIKNKYNEIVVNDLPKINKQKVDNPIEITEDDLIYIENIIIDYLILQKDLTSISHLYFKDTDGFKAYKILKEYVGVNKLWQKYFSKTNLNEIEKLLTAEEHQIILRSIKTYKNKIKK